MFLSKEGARSNGDEGRWDTENSREHREAPTVTRGEDLKTHTDVWTVTSYESAPDKVKEMNVITFVIFSFV